MQLKPAHALARAKTAVDRQRLKISFPGEGHVTMDERSGEHPESEKDLSFVRMPGELGASASEMT